MALGLSTQVWNDLYGRIISDSTLPLLQRAWREQWGAEGDVSFTASELPVLRRELATVLPDVPGMEARWLLEGLVSLTWEAEEQGVGLAFVAE